MRTSGWSARRRTRPARQHWREEIAGDDHHYLLGVSCFDRFMVLSERSDGLADLRLRGYAGEEQVIGFPEPVYTVSLGDNREFATDRIRVGYTSMVTPPSVIDYVVATRELILRKEQEIPSGYDKQRYVTRRLLAPAPDGAHVPDHHRPPRRLPARGRRAAHALRLRRLRPRHGPGVRAVASQPPRPRHGLRLRPCPRRRRDGLSLVSRGQAGGQAQQLHRLHCLRRVSGPRGLHPGRPDRDQGRQRRRDADGGGRQPAPRAVGLRRRRGAVRRRGQHHARPFPAADPDRVAGMGQPARGPGGARAAPRLLALRQRPRASPTRRCWSPPASATRA